MERQNVLGEESRTQMERTILVMNLTCAVCLVVALACLLSLVQYGSSGLWWDSSSSSPELPWRSCEAPYAAAPAGSAGPGPPGPGDDLQLQQRAGRAGPAAAGVHADGQRLCGGVHLLNGAGLLRGTLGKRHGSIGNLFCTKGHFPGGVANLPHSNLCDDSLPDPAGYLPGKAHYRCSCKGAEPGCHTILVLASTRKTPPVSSTLTGLTMSEMASR